MRSRIAIAALLASGALMSSGGAALGVSALSAPTGASEAQYGPDDSAPLSESGSPTLGGPKTATATKTKSSQGVEGASDKVTVTPEAKAQAPRQLEASGRDSLPFTGYAAIPLLLGGLALLASGLAIRRSTRRNSI